MQIEFNLADLFENVADAIPEREALACGRRRLTYAQLEERANKAGPYLHAKGIGKGDHVGLHLYNGTEYVEGMLAAFKVRAVPINIQLPVRRRRAPLPVRQRRSGGAHPSPRVRAAQVLATEQPPTPRPTSSTATVSLPPSGAGNGPMSASMCWLAFGAAGLALLTAGFWRYRSMR